MKSIEELEHSIDLLKSALEARTEERNLLIDSVSAMQETIESTRAENVKMREAIHALMIPQEPGMSVVKSLLSTSPTTDNRHQN